jgi:hypothetical protein
MNMFAWQSPRALRPCRHMTDQPCLHADSDMTDPRRERLVCFMSECLVCCMRGISTVSSFHKSSTCLVCQTAGMEHLVPQRAMDLNTRCTPRGVREATLLLLGWFLIMQEAFSGAQVLWQRGAQLPAAPLLTATGQRQASCLASASGNLRFCCGMQLEAAASLTCKLTMCQLHTCVRWHGAVYVV